VTISDLKTQVLSLAFPRRFNQSLLALKEHLIFQGLTDIQRYIPSFKQGNVDIIPGSFDMMVSGATIIDAPDGQIQQVLVGADGCRTIPASLRDKLVIQRMQQEFANAYDCGDSSIESVYPTASVSWARDGGDLMVYPWVPTGWSIGIRWDGIKRSWANTYDVWWADKVIEILRMHAIAYDDVKCPEFEKLFQLYREELAKLRAEIFNNQNPTQYDPYSSDVLWPSCGTTNDTGTVAAVAS